MATTTMAVAAQASGTHVREHTSVLAAAEKRLLIWIAHRLPGWVNSDHLTALGAVAMVGTAAAFAAASIDARWLALVPVLLAVNWFGDSLDGTVARVRNQQRPRYGYYLDHVVDIANTTMLFTGLALSGLCSPWIAMALMVGLPAALRRVVPGHARAGRVSDLVCRHGADRVAPPAVGRRACRDVAARRPAVRPGTVPVVRRRRAHGRHRHGRRVRAVRRSQHACALHRRAAPGSGRDGPMIQSGDGRRSSRWSRAT